MFIVLLRFSSDEQRAGELMQGHQQWLQRGFEDGAFLLAGSIRPRLGGAILAHATSLAELRARIDADPFVAHGVVSAEVLEVAASKADERLRFLLG